MKVFIVLFKFQNTIYAVADNRTLTGYRTEKEALDAFEIPYDECHKRSYESSMSACVHYIFFQPKVFGFSDIEEIREKLFNDKQIFYTKSCSSVAGRMVGIECDQEKASLIYERAKTPQLIQ